jgi:hypothetical protein
MKILLAVMLFAGVGYGQARLDGRWWNKAKEDERDGVVDGLIDCLRWDSGKDLPALSLAKFKEEISMFYKRKPLDTRIAQVLLSLPKSPQKPRAGGEDYSKEKHGYFDGQYWGTSTVEQQNGFVTGYLSCRTGIVPRKGLVNETVQRISKWYETHSSSSEWDKKVAEILQSASPHGRRK